MFVTMIRLVMTEALEMSWLVRINILLLFAVIANQIMIIPSEIT